MANTTSNLRFSLQYVPNVDLLCAPFTMTRQNLTGESEVGKQSDFFFGWSEGNWPMIRVVINAI